MAQSKEVKQIDAQIAIANEYYKNFKTKELLYISQDILSKSGNLDYEKGLAQGYYFRACVFFNIGNYNKSIFYLNQAKTFANYLKTDPGFHARIYHLFGSNYNRLELFTLASKNILKAIDIIEKVKFKNDAFLLNQNSNYTELSYVYIIMGKPDSAYYYLKKGRLQLDKIKSKDVFREKSLSDTNLGNHFYTLEKDDSARYYYTKAISVLGNKDHYYKVGAILGLGNVDIEENKIDDALRNYLEALELVKKDKLSFGLREAYIGLEMVYEKKEDHKKAKEYQILYTKFDESVALANKMQRNSLINEVILFEKKEQEANSNKKFIKIASVVGIIILLFSIGAFYFVKRKRKELITEKEHIIQEKEFENQDLKQKVNESFEEVVQLARENSPEFLTRFQEIYPNFSGKLKEIYPDITSEDVRFCALLKLNFSTKDISDYTFVTVRTVQTRKSRLRKKFNIPSDVDIYLWMNEL